MIKNDRQCRITQADAERFAEALGELKGETEEDLGAHSLFKAKKDAVRIKLVDVEGKLQVASV